MCIRDSYAPLCVCRKENNNRSDFGNYGANTNTRNFPHTLLFKKRSGKTPDWVTPAAPDRASLSKGDTVATAAATVIAPASFPRNGLSINQRERKKSR